LETNFSAKEISLTKNSGQVAFSSPSNIALVKYWGKRPVNEYDITFLFEGAPKPSFEPKIVQFLERIDPYCNFLKAYKYTINSENTFPHSSGIASSASGMSALAMCFVEIEEELGAVFSAEEKIKKASFLARLGSGSACRSLEGPITVWGQHKEIKNSSDDFAVLFKEEVHEVFKDYQDTILLIDKGEKQVSSTVGHNLMHGHPFASERFKQANNNLSLLKKALISGDTDSFIEIVESEALSLHAMMMTSLPYFILMKPNTLEVINEIWLFRKETKLPVCFTLDAGANVHILYPENVKNEVLEFIKGKLSSKCQNEQYICDSVGIGVQKL